MREIGDRVNYPAYLSPDKPQGPFTIGGYTYYRSELYYVGVNDKGECRDLHNLYITEIENEKSSPV